MSLSRAGLTGGTVYALGQVFNLIFQLLLLFAQGQQGYGRIGLAHVTFVAILFIGELGYGLLFLREQPGTPAWERRWRLALGHRLITTLVLDAGAVGFWVLHYGVQDEGLYYLLAVLPATLFALATFSAPLIAAGRPTLGFLVQQVAWPVATVTYALALLTGLSEKSGILVAGSCVTAGYLAQAIANVAAFRARPALLPLFHREGWRMLRTSLNLSVLAFLGVVNDRLTAFLMEALAPGYLAAYLLLGQALNGAAGMLTQLNRVLIAREAVGTNVVTTVQAVNGLILIPMSVLLLVGVAEFQSGFGHVPAGWISLSTPVLCGWMLSVIGGSLAAVLIGRHQEAALARALFLGVVISVSAQLFGATIEAPQAVLWGRALGTAFVVALAYRLCRIWPSPALPALGLAASISVWAFSTGSVLTAWVVNSAALVCAFVFHGWPILYRLSRSSGPQEAANLPPNISTRHPVPRNTEATGK